MAEQVIITSPVWSCFPPSTKGHSTVLCCSDQSKGQWGEVGRNNVGPGDEETQLSSHVLVGNFMEPVISVDSVHGS